MKRILFISGGLIAVAALLWFVVNKFESGVSTAAKRGKMSRGSNSGATT